jgi:hypothetical protein
VPWSLLPLTSRKELLLLVRLFLVFAERVMAMVSLVHAVFLIMTVRIPVIALVVVLVMVPSLNPLALLDLPLLLPSPPLPLPLPPLLLPLPVRSSLVSVVRRMATVVLVHAAHLIMIVRIPATALVVVSVMVPSPNPLALKDPLPLFLPLP